MIAGWRRVTGCCYTSDMLGELQNQWSPWRYLRERYPCFTVFEDELEPGYLGCLDHRKKIIWLTTNLTSAEKRCTIAHEIGHLELDLFVQGMWASASEARVDEWAARQLIAFPTLLQALRWSIHLDEVAEELWVDRHTLGVRLRTLADPEQDAVMAAIERRWGAA